MGRANQRSPEVAERRIRAMELRRDGKSYAEIADELDYSSAGSASKDVSRALSQLTREAGEELIALELARTEALLSRAVELSESDDMKAVKAVDVATRVLARRAKMLGLDMTYTEAQAKRKTEQDAWQGSLIGSMFAQAQDYFRAELSEDEYEDRYGDIPRLSLLDDETDATDSDPDSDDADSGLPRVTHAHQPNEKETQE